MVDFILFMVFSVMETCAMIYLMFRMFKIDLMLKEMVFASAIMAFVSYTLRAVYDLAVLDVSVQLLLMLLFVWMLFRIHLFYAIITTGMAFQAYSLLQSLFYYIMRFLGIFALDLPVISDASTYFLQIITIISALAIGNWIQRKRKGFDFVPDNPKGRLNLHRREKVLFLLLVPSFVSMAAVLFLAKLMGEFYFIAMMMYVPFLYSYIHFSYKRDRMNDH